MSKEINETESKAKLLEAQQAVNRGDVIGMLKALTESRYLDGLTRRLKHKWADSLPSSIVDDCVAQAVDAACDTAFKGQKIRNLGSWLWKTATNIAEHIWHEEYASRQDFNDTLLVGEVKETISDSDRLRRDELEETRRKKAIRVARELLPRVGEGQILDVMELVIDAAANEIPDLPASSIAESLGITESAARSLVSRGLRRLRRRAEQEGVEMPTDLPETDTEYDD